MILIIRPDRTDIEFDKLICELESMKMKTHVSVGENTTIVGLVGDTSLLDINEMKANPLVLDVKRVSEPYKRANRKFNSADTVIDINGVPIGGGYFTVIAGPCSVESQQQLNLIACNIKKSGASVLRGGAFKPRTSPYAFQGLEAEGIKILENAKSREDIPIITEIMDISDLRYFENVDIIQVGARNMQNFRLLKMLGRQKKPVLLKRGMSSTIEELLMSAEYIMSEGNNDVILCERGIRTFETSTRNTLDISAVPVLKKLTHLPVIVDPSHACGNACFVPALSKAAIAAGADGIMVEVHNNPAKALSDGAQSITLEEFDCLMNNIRKYAELENKKL
ncbi:MAG: 3-deoxy-7-phosphoheptulonate synthase [Clostridia bacterium]|nr:3-deoxy-7-phosphoheptulonate synthase [Clostridia bacterium]